MSLSCHDAIRYSVICLLGLLRAVQRQTLLLADGLDGPECWSGRDFAERPLMGAGLSDTFLTGRWRFRVPGRTTTEVKCPSPPIASHFGGHAPNRPCH